MLVTYVTSHTTVVTACVGGIVKKIIANKLLRQLIHIHYTGVVEITPGLSAILGGSPASKTTEYGHSCTFFQRCLGVGRVFLTS